MRIILKNNIEALTWNGHNGRFCNYIAMQCDMGRGVEIDILTI